MILKAIRFKHSGTHALARVTVLIGPNNVGKSQVLRDVVRVTAGANPDSEIPRSSVPLVAVACDYCDGLTPEILLRGLRVHERRASPRFVAQGIGFNLQKSAAFSYEDSYWKNVLKQPPTSTSAPLAERLHEVMRARMVLLDPESRLKVIRRCQARRPTDAPQSVLQALQFPKAGVVEDLDTAFFGAFGRHIVIDRTECTWLAMRLATEVPTLPDDPVAALLMNDQLPLIETEGDGYRSFAATIATMLVAEGSVILLSGPPQRTQVVEGEVEP